MSEQLITGVDLNSKAIFDNNSKSVLLTELQKAEHNYQSLVDTVDGIVWQADPDTFQFSFVSKAAVKLLGYPIQQWLDDPTFWRDHIHPDDRERAVAYCTKCTKQKKSHQLEYRMIAKDESVVCIHDNVSVIVENDEPVLLRGIMTDCTERKKAEKELQISHDRLLFHLENSPLAFIEWDNQIRTISWSRRAEEIFGWTEKEVLTNGFNWIDKVYEEDLPFVSKIVEQLVAGTVNKNHVEHRNYTKDGRVIWCEWFNSVLKNKEGKVIAILSLIKDITERKLAEFQLKESNERYNLISKATHDMVWDWNLITDDVHRNAEGWKKILKGKEAEETGKREDWLSRVHPDDRKRTEKVINELIKSDTGQLFEVEFRILRDDNTIGFIEDRGYIIRNEKGKAIRLIGASQDITERKLAEQKLKENETVITNLNKNLKKRAEELTFQNKEKEKRAADLIIANKELVFRNEEKKKRAAELIIANKELVFQNEEKEKRAAELIIANKELIFQNKEKKKRAAELIIANEELVFQNEEKEKRAAELIIANKELKHAQDELIKLSMVAKETINGVVIRDENQNIVWVNNAFTKMYGYELHEVIGRNPKSFLPGPETDVEVVNYVKKQYIQKEPFIFEILNYTKARNKIYVSVQVQPIFDENGGVKQSFSLHTDITRQKELEEKVMLEKIIQQKQITDAVFSAQENERNEIGRELHDNVNQLLSAIRMYIDLARTDEKGRDSLLTDASAFALNAIEEIRKLSKTLVIPLIKEIGLKDVIKDLIAEIMLVHPVKILFTSEFTEAGLTDKYKLNIFRIVQEQINNVLKHAQAENIDINIEDNFGKLLVSISDDGIGFDTTKRKPGVGITNIKSRSELYNGSLRLNSELSKGTTLSITFNKADLLVNDHNPSDA